MTTMAQKFELSPTTTHERFEAIVAGLGNVAGRAAPLTKEELRALDNEREDARYHQLLGDIVLSVN
ncbi:hypothetical protein KBC51_00340 [Candidatus Saccharibacteria bacterium]|jgi:hypothetical protein|nr:hypothetical protein [Candidatus Saccharibacteria bacterium]